MFTRRFAICSGDSRSSPLQIQALTTRWPPDTKKRPRYERLYNTFDSNINNLTSQCDVGRSGVGAPYKSTICTVYKCTEENSSVTPTEQVLDKGGFSYERKHVL